MITCPKCTKENQDHYKFCLGCGAELPRDASPKKFAPGTPPGGVPAARADGRGAAAGGPAMGGAPMAAAPMGGGGGAAAMAMGGGLGASPVATPLPAPAQFAAPAPVPTGAPPVICPQCEHPNPSNNKFCASCGFKLAKPVSMPAPAAVPAAGGASVVLTALRADGSEAGSYPLPGGVVTIGRDTGSIFAGDSYLSPRHATFTPRGGRVFVKDESSLNGIYRKLRREEPMPIHPSDIFRIGQEILRYEPLTPLPQAGDGVERLGSPSKGYIGRIALIIGRDTTGNAFPIPESGLHLGRERGDVLFPEDGYVSGLHCRLQYQKGTLYLTDLGSSNGTFIRLLSEAELQNGDILLMGQQLFRVTI